MNITRLSVFAYTKQVIIETRHQGIHYTYLWYMNEEGFPCISLMSSTKTKERNGTVFTITLDGDPNYRWGSDSDLISFIKRQTNYFENIVYQGSSIESLNQIKNYRYKDFIVSDYSPHSELHMVIGQVTYHISWTDLGISPISVPIALNFKVEDGLIPLASRDTIRYTSKNKKILLAKIKKVANWFVDRYNKSVEDTDDVSAYLRASRYKGSMILHGRDFNIRDFEDHADSSLKLPSLKGLKGLKRYFNNFNDLFKGLYLSHRLDTRTTKINSNYEEYRILERFLFTGDNLLWYDAKMSPNKNRALVQDSKTWYLVKKRNIPKTDYEKWFGIFKDDKLLQKQIDIYESYMESFLQEMPKYSDVKPTKLAKQKSTIDKEGKILIHTARQNLNNDYKVTYEKKYVKIESLLKKQLIYGEREAEYPLLFNNKNIVFVYGSKAVIKALKQIPNSMTTKQFKAKYNRHFAKAVTALRIKNIFNKYSFLIREEDYLEKLYPVFNKQLKKLEAYRKQYQPTIKSSFETTILTVAEENNWWDFKMLAELNAFEKNAKKFEFLGFIKQVGYYNTRIDPRTLDFVVDYCKLKKIRLGKEHYNIQSSRTADQ